MRLLSKVFVALLAAALAFCQAPEPDGAGVRAGTLPAAWLTGGSDCATVPEWQIHAYNEDFYILRESGCTNYEKPFLYLLFGQERALLEDTGAGSKAAQPDTLRAVNSVVEAWCQRNHRERIPLVVTHSHSHGDHKSGDPQFAARPMTTMVPLTVEGTANFFHIANWPDSPGTVDLGNRTLDVLAIPGHDTLSIAFYDRQTGVLLTGDSLYPGRLYVRDFPAFTKSTQRLVDFTQGKIVAHILGTHIEQSVNPYKDYPVGTRFQPEEHALPLTRGTLLELNDALHRMGTQPRRQAFRDFTIWPNKTS